MPEKNVVPIVTDAPNSRVAVTPDSYANEPIRFAPLQVVDLASEAAAVSEPYRNQAVRGSRFCSGVLCSVLGSGFTVLAARGREHRTANLEPRTSNRTQNQAPRTQNPERRHTETKNA